MKTIFNYLKERKVLFAFLCLLVLLFVGVYFIPGAFSLQQPIRSVEIFSQNVSYQNNAPGSWKVTKSASWTSVGNARITVDVDTVLQMKDNHYRDIILVLDMSGSMNGPKVDKVKSDSISLVRSLLSNHNNRVGLISFNSNSILVSGLTNDENSLVSSINGLTVSGSTNYYKALKNVEEILESYVLENNRECSVLFLTDGSPNVDTPSEVGEYQYLKSTYSYVTFHGIQYEMGEVILDPVKKISDYQYIANIDNLYDVLFEASANSFVYDDFNFIDYVDSDYFVIDSVRSNIGNVTVDDDEVIWSIKDGLRSGSRACLIIDVTLKSEYLNVGGIYPTNSREEVISKMSGNNEDVNSNLTPILQNRYIVSYDANAPDGCVVGNVPSSEGRDVFDVVQVSDVELVCEGYQFKGWEVVANVSEINNNYFIMPENDVLFRGVWSKLSIVKSMNGTIYQKAVGTLMEQTDNVNVVFGKNLDRSTIETVTFVNSINVPSNVESWDVSLEQNGTVMAWIVLNGHGLYDLYIGEENKVVANVNSSNLFRGMSNLVDIRGFEYFDTSNVTDMSYMFALCPGLTSLDVGGFDTSLVTNMRAMFYNTSITNVDMLSGWNVSHVENMRQIFGNDYYLEDISGLRQWNTGSVTTMRAMFQNANSLSDISPLKKWNVSNVTSLNRMFFGNSNYHCRINSLMDLKDWNVSSVEDMDYMLQLTEELTNLEGLENWNTQSLRTMVGMLNGSHIENISPIRDWDVSHVTNVNDLFNGCPNLEFVDFSNWDFSSVTSSNNMFLNVTGLTSLKTPRRYPINSNVSFVLPVTLYDANQNVYTSLNNTSPVQTLLSIQ